MSYYPPHSSQCGCVLCYASAINNAAPMAAQIAYQSNQNLCQQQAGGLGTEARYYADVQQVVDVLAVITRRIDLIEKYIVAQPAKLPTEFTAIWQKIEGFELR